MIIASLILLFLLKFVLLGHVSLFLLGNLKKNNNEIFFWQKFLLGGEDGR